MKARCKDPENRSYGGRGISYDPRWESYDNFYADMGECPPAHSLERDDNNKGYSKGNCSWATKKAQANNRRTNRFYTLEGKTLSVSQWAAVKGLSAQTVFYRLRAGWDIERSLNEPLRCKFHGNQWGRVHD